MQRTILFDHVAGGVAPLVDRYRTEVDEPLDTVLASDFLQWRWALAALTSSTSPGIGPLHVEAGGDCRGVHDVGGMMLVEERRE